MKKKNYSLLFLFDLIISIISTLAIYFDDDIELSMVGLLIVFGGFLIMYPVIVIVMVTIVNVLTIPWKRYENKKFTQLVDKLVIDSEIRLLKKTKEILYFNYNDKDGIIFIDFRGLNIGLFVELVADKEFDLKKQCKELEKRNKGFLFGEFLVQSTLTKWKKNETINIIKERITLTASVIEKEQLDFLDNDSVENIINGA